MDINWHISLCKKQENIRKKQENILKLTPKNVGNGMVGISPPLTKRSSV